ncbi:MAG: ABC transporter permease [Mycoplasmatales bacterium]|nr:ABC transporter permease [Mycoplasmatales bacterium]
MNRHLWKSTFKSFFKNKVGIILLTLIIFLTATVFTLLQSTSNSFSSSYSNVVKKGNLHDFTVKEKYSNSGDLIADITTSQKRQEEIFNNQNASEIYGENTKTKEKYIYLFGKNSPLDLVYTESNHPEKNKTINNLPVRIKLNDILDNGIDTNGDGKKDSLKANFDLNFEVAGGNKNVNDYYKWGILNHPGSDENYMCFFYNTDQAYFDTINKNLVNSQDDVNYFISSQNWTNYSHTYNANHSFNIYEKKASFFDSNHIKGNIVYKESLSDLSKRVFTEIYQNMFEKKDVVDLNIKFNENKSTADIKNYLRLYPQADIEIKSQPYHPDVNGKAYDYSNDPNVFEVLKKNRNDILNKIQDEHSKLYKEELSNAVYGKNSKGELVFDVPSATNPISQMYPDGIFVKSRYYDENDNQMVEIEKSTKSISIEDFGNAYKVVDTINNYQDINSLVLYKGSSIDNSISNKALEEEIKTKQDAVSGNPKWTPVDKTKKWKYSSQGTISDIFSTKTIPSVLAVDPSSFEIIVSPSFASEYKLKPVSNRNSWYTTIDGKKEFDKNSDFYKMASEVKPGLATQNFINKNKNSYVKIGSMVFAVVGIGTSPDFAYPIVDEKNPVPNSKNQAIFFTNRNGFSRVFDSFRTNPREDYLSFKFRNDFKGDKEVVMKGIENISRKNMSWPPSIKIVSGYNDTNEKILLVPQRIAFLEKLNTTIKAITWLVVSSLMILTTLIIVLILKRNIASQKRNLGILHANGFTKKQIASSFILVGLIVTGLATIIGHILGYSLQFAFIYMFKNYWTIPIFEHSFSWLSFIFTVGIPIILITILIYSIAIYEMRGNVLQNMLGDKSSKFGDYLSAKATHKLKWFGIKSKFASSLIFSNLSKMMMIFIATTGAVTASTIAITTFGKFDKAISSTADSHNYNFAVDLVSPTIEGGQYTPVILENKNKYTQNSNDPYRIRAGWTGPNGEEKGPQNSIKTAKDWGSMMQFPSSEDAVAKKTTGSQFTTEGWSKNNYKLVPEAAKYLDKRVQTQLPFRVIMGGSSVPWEVAESLMPSNQISKSNQDLLDYIPKLVAFGSNNTKYNNLEWYKDLILINEDINNDRPINANLQKFGNDVGSGILGLNSELKKDFQEFIKESWDAGIYPYLITYNQVTTNLDDELYTSIRGETILKDKKGNVENIHLSIKGIKADSNFIKVNNINDLTKFNKPGIIPVIINKYTSEFFDLSVGSQFKMKVENTTDRFIRKIKKEDSMEKQFEVVGYMNSYSGIEMYTLRTTANELLGLDKTQGFNGLFSHEDKPRVLDNINLYSPSGFYPGFDTVISGGESEELLTQTIKQKVLFQNVPNQDDKQLLENLDVEQFVNTYSKSIYEAAISYVDWAKMSQFTFKSVNELSSNLIWLSEGLALVIAAIFIVIIGSMMVESNKRNIATLKVLGYRNKEIRNAFIKSFIPSLLIGTIIAIPIIFAILLAIKVSIMSFGAVLIPLNMLGWELISSAAIVVGIFVSIFIYSIRSLNSHSALEAFKQ